MMQFCSTGMFNFVPPQRNSTPLAWEMLHCAGCPHIPDTHEAKLPGHWHNSTVPQLIRTIWKSMASPSATPPSSSAVARRAANCTWASQFHLHTTQQGFSPLAHEVWVFLDVCLSIQVQYGHYGPLFFGVIRCTSPGPAVQDLLKLLPSASAHHYEPAHARKTPCSSGSSCRSIRHIDSKCQTESNQVNTREASFLAEWKSHICGNKDNPKPAGQDQNQPARVRRVTPANGMQLRNATSR